MSTRTESDYPSCETPRSFRSIEADDEDEDSYADVNSVVSAGFSSNQSDLYSVKSFSSEDGEIASTGGSTAFGSPQLYHSLPRRPQVERYKFPRETARRVTKFNLNSVFRPDTVAIDALDAALLAAQTNLASKGQQRRPAVSTSRPQTSQSQITDASVPPPAPSSENKPAEEESDLPSDLPPPPPPLSLETIQEEISDDVRSQSTFCPPDIESAEHVQTQESQVTVKDVVVSPEMFLQAEDQQTADDKVSETTADNKDGPVPVEETFESEQTVEEDIHGCCSCC